jgi:hypothetical protein
VSLLEEKNRRDFWGKPFPAPGTFRRVLRLDLSGGAALSPEIYAALDKTFSEGLSQFWKNRATLMRLGRLYSRNLFVNLGRLPGARALPEKTVSRPVLVAASGPSLDGVFSLEKKLLEAFFIIAVDTALPAFLSRGITPHLVAQVESQFAIEGAYTGAPREKLLIAADLTSRQKNAAFYFFSTFCGASFISRMRRKRILPPEFPAMGSVALSAVHLALRLRRGDEPVFVAGADFSFTPGKTHCKGSAAHKAALLETSRFSGLGDFAPAFSEGAVFTVAKDGARVVTGPLLMSYRAQFAHRFSGRPNLFDASASGLPLGLPAASLETLASAAKAWAARPVPEGAYSGEPENAVKPEAVRAFLGEEAEALALLRSLLRGEGSFGPETREEKIRSLLDEREYLYLHFPEGFLAPESPGFLNRVRAEIDFFLKDMNRALLD